MALNSIINQRKWCFILSRGGFI